MRRPEDDAHGRILFLSHFPYMALILAIGVGIYRYVTNRYTYSSLSSQILENRKLFWGSVPWHYGITLILWRTCSRRCFPESRRVASRRRDAASRAGIDRDGAGPIRAVRIDCIDRRRLAPKSLAQATTSYMDGVLLFVLLVQVGTGVGVAIFNRWGGLWYLHTAVPWFWSLAALHPDMSTVASLPLLPKLHFVTGFVVILLFPFSRLVHLVMFPLQYLWRPHQVVIWNRRPSPTAAYSKEITR